jgi:hypothetical protein
MSLRTAAPKKLAAFLEESGKRLDSRDLSAHFAIAADFFRMFAEF